MNFIVIFLIHFLAIFYILFRKKLLNIKYKILNFISVFNNLLLLLLVISPLIMYFILFITLFKFLINFFLSKNDKIRVWNELNKNPSFVNSYQQYAVQELDNDINRKLAKSLVSRSEVTIEDN